jgi:hypothetical protein
MMIKIIFFSNIDLAHSTSSRRWAVAELHTLPRDKVIAPHTNSEIVSPLAQKSKDINCPEPLKTRKNECEQN